MAQEYPSSPLLSCQALIRDHDKVLLVQRAYAPFKGYWGLPGGTVKLGETVEEALLREVCEETSLHVSIERFLGFFNAIERDQDSKVRWHYLILYFETDVKDGTLQAADDAAAVRWMTVSEARHCLLVDSVERCFQFAKPGQ